MLYYFKLGGRRIAYRKETGEVFRLSALAGQMLEQLSFPLPSACPSALRYAFAKYDSEAISAAYREVLSLGPENPPAAVVFPTPAKPAPFSLTVNGSHCTAEAAGKELIAAKECGEAPVLSFAELPEKEVPTSEELAEMTAFVEKTVKEETRASGKEPKKHTCLFSVGTPAKHDDPRCQSCFAEHFCPLSEASHPGCTLACLLAECVLTTNEE